MGRLKYVVNNQRFLILPLASKILALNTKRLSGDWQAAFGHHVLMAETFVDYQRFKGTCYRAAGWQILGQTSGYGRKTVLVMSLVPDARQYLSGMLVPPEIAKHHNGKPFHLVSAFLHNTATTVAQTRVEDKSNEIPAFREVLKDMDINWMREGRKII